MLKKTFIELLRNYTENENLIIELWTEIERYHSGKKRHYHNLKHLENLLYSLIDIKDEISNWEAILFTLFYHDIIYNSTKSDNEEKSSELARKRMQQICVPNDTLELCIKHILTTKAHTISSDKDTNYFTDADLSILGQDWETYSEYYKNVRKEYSIYPNIIYNPGRKKVLKHFLEMNRIYKSEIFYNKLEVQAKQNIQMELELL